MKTKTKILKTTAVLMLSLASLGTWAQTSQTITQTICPGTEPYKVTPGNTANTFLWSISTGTAGVDWTITTPALDSTNVIWANPVAPVTYHLSLTETNSDSCDKIVSVDVTINPKPSIPVASLTQPTCITATGTITVTSPAPGTGITYTIVGTLPVVGTITNATGIFAGLASGNYDITTTNSYICTSVAASVTLNAQPATPTTSAIWHN